MNQELIQSLSVITEEEQKILAGSADIDRTLYMDREDMVIDSDKLLEAGQLITIRPHTRFVHFPEHTHNYVEVIYMCRGETTHVVDGRELKLKEGELLFLNQHAVQEIQPAGQDDIAVNFIILPESAAGFYCGMPLRRYQVRTLSSFPDCGCAAGPEPGGKPGVVPYA